MVVKLVLTVSDVPVVLLSSYPKRRKVLIARISDLTDPVNTCTLVEIRYNKGRSTELWKLKKADSS